MNQRSKITRITQSRIDEPLKPYISRSNHGSTRYGEEIQLYLPIDEKPRRIVYHLMEPLPEQLQEFLENDIREKVRDQEAITRYSPIVVQPKPKNPSDLRLSLD